MVTLIQLEQLISIARAGTISAAAKAISLSQPALSRSMQALEEELGVALFIRTKNRAVLSETGKKAVEYAKRVVEEAARFREGVGEYDRKLHTVSVASYAPAGLWNAQFILSEICPGMTVQTTLIEDTVDEGALLSGLVEGRYTMVVLAVQPEDERLYTRKLCREQLCVAFPERLLPPEYKKGCYLEDIEGKTFITLAGGGRFERILREKMRLSRFIYLNNAATVEQIAHSSKLPVFTSDLALRYFGDLPGRTAVPLLDKELTAEYYCVTKKDVIKELAGFMRSGTTGDS